MKEFNRHLEHYLDAQGKPLKKLFEDDKAAQEFTTFVEHLRNLATGKK